jgi:hypothetical protein
MLFRQSALHSTLFSGVISIGGNELSLVDGACKWSGLGGVLLKAVGLTDRKSLYGWLHATWKRVERYWSLLCPNWANLSK